MLSKKLAKYMENNTPEIITITFAELQKLLPDNSNIEVILADSKFTARRDQAYIETALNSLEISFRAEVTTTQIAYQPHLSVGNGCYRSCGNLEKELIEIILSSKQITSPIMVDLPEQIVDLSEPLLKLTN